MDIIPQAIKSHGKIYFMIVYCNENLSIDLKREGSLASKLFSGLIFFFQNKNFGSGLNEIVFIMLAGDKEYQQHYGVGRIYKKRSKTYSSIFLSDYEVMENLSDEELLKYLSNELIDEAKEIKKLNIPDFDTDSFLHQLSIYLNESMPEALLGKYLSEGKVLNPDIKETMRQKFLKL